MNHLKLMIRGLHKNFNIGNVRLYSDKNNPFSKTWKTLSNDLPFKFANEERVKYPEHVDIVVIGGGFIGSSVAYWLKSRTAEGLSVVVLEKDLTYREVQNNFSALGTLTQHFSLPENIYLSQYSVEFLRNIKEHLSSNVDIQYQPCKNLILACDKYADRLEHNCTIQSEYGLKNELLTTDDISYKYPWLSMHDIKLGCIGTEAEGVFNPWQLLRGLVHKSQELGAQFINAEVVGFELVQQRDVLMEGVTPGSFERINKVKYKTPDNEEYELKFAACVLAAGEDSANIGKLAKIGTGSGLLSVPLPIEKREYNVYSIEDMSSKISLNTPIVTDTSGLWLQRNGLQNNLLCGHIPLDNDETRNLTKEEYFKKVVKPSITNRMPNTDAAKVNELTVGKQDCNTFDYSGILGPHPYHNNLYLAAGFGRHGCLFAPGLGRAIAELIVDSHYLTVDLTRFHFDRILTNEPLMEFNVY